ncbi:MAG: hypothetical protein A3C85_02090 [Candidatus Doudnabacteria bacterium RIFCSPHIGHO2_02_FULL_48_21]|uniref:DAGKc domain-containing protein n=1 Tax=Candidatus Doudnabacteria bacterium RIFCSPLOWO2_02_FULL_48_13 TaxID=1817845 RepID=A0A1F5QCL2_9BACT|nr:MAG: hypothetical protein A3K05_01855 [Candidatus Doudnabacteria bacterium RIFCSPHIGHO2_01_48_18]OGE77348.1 MAG: hypothetical protein A2668_03170 [Candidatus Doudnabacteria bacterium RIFCSPHIGHO2_01_FULL_48_180]OGE93122.1 MAG: hypothetical protein A3C85_02090 [Candidatus Doudnabacteria bacterium RIFCSPHIGHO2_02_FULL_48_21]OGE97861.1 MAG: hypothetical protein A3A83_04180 [Candidatus Doudnabacteria bacterium RIFCSPLOWO2_01_FULL_48_57]OGE99941.1 MAG: hypothetical protein A3J05_04925 [Candidatus
MYFYIFDPGKDKEVRYFERIQGRLLNLLAENHIEGETYRVTSIRTVELLVEQAIGLEARTIIVVGGDSTLNRAINTLIRQNADITVGFISLDPGSRLGQIFGISPDIEQSVKTLAGRLVAGLDLGEINEHYFLSKVELGENQFSQIEPGIFGLSSVRRFMKLQPFEINLSLDNKYKVSSEVFGAQIINCRNNEGCKVKLGDPTDKLLDILLLSKLASGQIIRYRKELATGCLDNVPGATIMHAKKVEVLGPRKLPLSIEGQVYTKAPAIVSVAKRKIKMIVGKTRQF